MRRGAIYRAGDQSSAFDVVWRPCATSLPPRIATQVDRAAKPTADQLELVPKVVIITYIRSGGRVIIAKHLHA